MKKLLVVLVVSAVLIGVSTRQTVSASDDVSGDDQEDQIEEVTDDQLPYEVIIENWPSASTEEYVPSETSGTITCSGNGETVRVVIKGNLMTGLTSLIPAKMMRRISLAREGLACWGSSLGSVCQMTQPICGKNRKHELICQTPTNVHVVFSNARRMQFVPQIGGYGVFDLKRWKIIGCLREGCDGVCHHGEKCRQGSGCTINSN